MKKPQITFLIFSLIIGLGLSLQLKSVSQSTGGIISSQKAKQLAAELKTLKDRKIALGEEIEVLEGKLKAFKDSEGKKDEAVKDLKEELEKYELIAGYSAGAGPGIIIRLSEPKQDSESNILSYNYEFLLAIINKLNASGAEGISINNERVVATTDMNLSGDKLFINGNPVIPPFEIKAIGRADTLEAAMNLRYGIVWELRKYYGLEISVEKKDKVKIPRYKSDKKEFQFAKPVENW